MPNTSTGKVYVLAIGIEHYDQTVNNNPLPGCTKDVESFLEYLTNRFGDNRLVINQLMDCHATRKGIIEAFLGKQNKNGTREPAFFADAKPTDTFIFYYSGHGSTETPPSEWGLPGNELETLLCYDSRIPGRYDLSDKELNFLLSKVTQKIENTIVIVDSCHSDSIFRDEKKGVCKRNEPAQKGVERPVNSYLPEVQAHFGAANRKKLPGTDFLSLSACSHNESAWGTSKGGYFTRFLLKVLKKNGDTIPSYNELLHQIKALVGNTRERQIPRLGSWGKVNPHWKFLTQELASEPDMPVVFWERDGASWFVGAGAFHGYRIEDVEHQIIPIYLQGEKEVLFYAKIDQLGVDKSRLYFVDEQGEPGVDVKEPDFNTVNIYVAGLFRTGFSVNFVNEDEFISTHRRAKAFSFIHDESADFKLEVLEESYCIYQKKEEKWHLIHGIKDKSDDAALYILTDLKAIADWHFALDLHSPSESFIAEKQVSFDLTWEGINLDTARAFDSIDQQDFDVEFDGKEFDAEFKIKNNSKEDLYYALLHFDRKFNIDNWNEGDTTINPGNDVSLETGFFISDRKLDETEDHFILIVSLEELNVGTFRRLPFPESSHKWQEIFDPSAINRGASKPGTVRKLEPWQKQELDKNWLVKRIKVTTTRK